MDKLRNQESTLWSAEMKGRKKAYPATAKSMKTDNMPIELISKYTGLSFSEIEAL